MHIKTILNRVTDYKSFVFGKATWLEMPDRLAIEVEVHPRRNGRRICGGCGEVRPGYDTQAAPRRFEFVPLLGIAVFFVYHMRRVQCPSCGIHVERVPWADGKSPLTTEYKWFLARWARRMSWKEVADAFGVSWDRVYEAVKHAVSWGLRHRSLEDIRSIGIDEVQWRKGHRYQTVAYQIDEHRKRLLWVGPERTSETLHGFFRFLGEDRTRGIEFICSDMWQGYIEVIREKARHVVHVLDRFHVMQRIGQAINDVRAAEVKQLQADGYEPVLRGARWLLLKRPENLTASQAVKMDELLKYNLKSIRSHLMKEDFQRFWNYQRPHAAGRFLDQWCTRAMRSQIEPMKRVARSMRDKRTLILNWFRAGGTISAGTVEGFNNKLKLVTRKSYGFRTQEAYETALYHNLAALPEPVFTHRFS